MNKHNFHIRLVSTYGDDNQVRQLDVEIHENEQWQPLKLDATTPGFVVFVSSIFTCQHLFLRTNSFERGLQLASASGEIRVQADSDWLLERVEVIFDATLARGTAGREDVEYIIERMKQCPVSRNLPTSASIDTSVVFIQPHA